MSSIKEKLYSLQRPARQQPEQVSPHTENLAEFLDAQWEGEDPVKYLVREKRYPLSFEHGVSLERLSDISGETFAVLARNESYEQLSLEDLLFIDTETTGLAGGSGTYVFLVGVGFLKKGSLIIRQFFLPAIESEAAMMLALENLLNDFKGFVSYNGKSYDLPLIRSRFVMNRLRCDFDRFYHIDLLHASRKFWKAVFDDKSLQGVEKNVLGFRRSGDIPGAEIPKRYFSFLADQNPGEIKPILQHNVMDILSMASLMIIFDELVRRPDKADLAFNKLGLVKSYEQMGKREQAIGVSKRVLISANEQESAVLLKKQALLCKREGRLEQAAEIWTGLIDNYALFDPDVYIELAKYFEHRKRELFDALAVIERLEKRLRLSLELKKHAGYAEYLEDLLHRKKRVQLKIERLNSERQALSD